MTPWGVWNRVQSMTYRVILQGDKRYSVETIGPKGKQSIIPDFRDQAEAGAWIVQTQRMLHDPRDQFPTPGTAYRRRDV
jgi:hypothetical protein